MNTPATTLPAFTPVPRKRERSNGWKPEVQRAFIEALADTGSVKAACKRVGRAEVGAYMLRRHPQAESFRKAWQAALDLGIQKIEDVAMDRALNGVEVPVYAYGKIIGTRTVYNDRLLMFMLRNRAPARFAADGARGMSAVDQTMLKRLKKQWREEWEQEEYGNEQEVLDSIDDVIDDMKAEWQASLDRLSAPARAAYDEYKRLAALEEEDEGDEGNEGVDTQTSLPAPDEGD
ncbi:hypothetical protein [Altererythrobacter sp. ZODW24]|uniref:hypothetical protein n=1 Tax=Altererythrobacter sp. ZODW24 TaxID=2185142 RepID=UPI0013B3AC44|nr:hypothetical protein [Altererythrobacter sp. ZODW24]